MYADIKLIVLLMHAYIVFQYLHTLNLYIAMQYVNFMHVFMHPNQMNLPRWLFVD